MLDISTIPDLADKCEKCVVSVGVASLTAISIIRWIGVDFFAGLAFWKAEKLKNKKLDQELQESITPERRPLNG